MKTVFPQQNNSTLYHVTRRAAWPIIVFSVLTAVLSLWYSFHHLRFSTSRSDLIASDQ